MSARDLLFELGTEELPPRALLSLSAALTEGVVSGLNAAGIPHGKVRGFATPRRLAVLIQKLAEHQPVAGDIAEDRHAFGADVGGDPSGVRLDGAVGEVAVRGLIDTGPIQMMGIPPR